MSQRSAIVVVAVGVLAAAFVFFEPWTLGTDRTVNEPPPSVAPATGPSTPPEPRELASGRFVSQEHETSGSARIIELPEGERVLRLEDFETSNGPDLHVWLSVKKAGGGWFKYGTARAVKLGELKANRGSHNYAIPGDADLAGLNSVVIWCKRFFVAFGSAPLDL